MKNRIQVSFQQAAQLVAQQLIANEKVPEGADLRVDYHIGSSAQESDIEFTWEEVIEDAEIIDE